MDPPDIFEAVIYTRWPCRTPSGLTVGCVYVEIERRSSHELVSISALTICTQKKQIAPPAAVGEKKIKRFFSSFPKRRCEEFFGCSLKAICLKKTLQFRVSIGIGLGPVFFRKPVIYSAGRSQTPVDSSGCPSLVFRVLSLLIEHFSVSPESYYGGP